ncbi:putative ABC-type amino acid transport/signal transduction systems, periplasmic component/domain [Candidatus Terasakiella magnetica]|uniref:Putative ABC-type amino acid transport/signal transduction systems, periplasmic component/domain n=1 Tax=Candidatus Terasakiella magnetica TaxID=1867952 RepID=A0A1C3RJB9_9PROT|nr:hypothetical protein [Candidatus Terasakiella magnetica]SCA57355.1 putative ABC-type amino acid transport/signal transduction systems, periplasmic component/domain [Candidatus Terasakiella magnetica]
MMYRCLSLIILFTALFFNQNSYAEAAKEVKIYTYHTHPPFIISNETGLTHDLAKFLTNKSDGQYKFTVSPSSRPRVNKVITGKKLAIVPWVNPAWFKDKAETKYLWSAETLLNDGNSILSTKVKPVMYDGAKSLEGMIFGGLHGHNYPDIDPYIEKGGNIRRVNSDNHLDNLEKLINGDIDCMLMPTSSAHFEKSQNAHYKNIFIAPKKHSSYKRRILVINHHKELKAFLDQTLANHRNEWKTLVSPYQ